MAEQQARLEQNARVLAKSAPKERAESAIAICASSTSGVPQLAVKDQGSNFLANPPDDFALKQGTVLIVMGETDSIRRASADADQKVPQV